MNHHSAVPRDQRGSALLMVLLAMVVLALAAAGFMIASNVETHVAGHDLRGSQSLNIAEAGVAEAMARIRNGDIPNTLNPRMVAQIFLTVPGQVPALTGDSIGLATAQPAGAWLPYSTATRDDRALTIQYKTDAARTVVYRYDATKNPAVQTSSGQPIFTITSTGRKGRDRRRVVSEVVQKPVKVNAKGALCADVLIDFSGNSEVCGYNHFSNTPQGTSGRGPCLNYEVGSGNMPGAWSSGDILWGGSSNQNGDPPRSPTQTGFYAGPWDALSMDQSEFFGWLGTPLTTEPNPPRGVYYLDNNSVSQDKSGSFAYQGGDGEGFLYVDGDLTINGGFNFVGLIYVEGDLKINGTCWILGGIIVKGKTRIKIENGDCTILFSQDAITETITRHGGQVVTLSWLETR